MILTEAEYLAHYGILRKSGRYPWGSGETQSIRNKMFLDYVNDLKRQGLTDAEIGRGLALKDDPSTAVSSTAIRAAKSIAKNEQLQSNRIMAQRLADKGMSNGAIAARMGLAGESSVRALLAPGKEEKLNSIHNVANILRDDVDKFGYIDVGTGVEAHIGVTDSKLKVALAMLQEEGYTVHSFKIKQVGTGLDTEMKVLAKPGVTQKEVWLNQGEVRQISQISTDNGSSFTRLQPPMSLDLKRVGINYAEDGGDKADGVIYVRPGVEDVSLGKSSYAQVRVAVNGTHYLKGMAMYKDDLPDGIDVLFNTNKSDTGNKLDALKPMKDDPDNPFGTSIRRQITKPGPDGKPILTSAMNLVHEEGDWLKWSDSLATQVLSKQRPKFAKEQLDKVSDARKKEFDEIMALTNPTVRRKLLAEFADSTDSAAVHLKAAALPNQGWHAILPVNSLPPNQIYAPNFQNGERVVLIRYPHGGTFEIPELTVNNKHPESKKLLGNARDAVGIHHSVAERLSGADFDGDTVLVIPNGDKKIVTSPALEGLKNFDPKASYPGYPGMKKMQNKQLEMGKVSNLITDMTVRNASPEELARAIRHSMVVIDAEKHNLNYKQSAIDNGIAQLREKYQFSEDGSRGASTLFSRAKGQQHVNDRKPRLAKDGGPIDPVTGERAFQETGRINYKTGELKKIRSTKLAETKDAHTLSSGTPIEKIYADHSNKLKAMANQARLEQINTPLLKYDPSAKKVYSSEVASLDAKLALAIRNRPLERQAQLIANTVIKAKRAENPNDDNATRKKVAFQALEDARHRTGAKPQKIEITPKEWEAIQAGAISDNKLSDILANANMETVRALATPRAAPTMTAAKTSRANAMLKAGYSRAEVAKALGVSLSTLDVATSEESG